MTFTKYKNRVRFLLKKLRIGSFGSYFGDVFTPLYPTGEINAALIWKIPFGRVTSGGEQKRYNSRIAIRETILQLAKTRVNEEVMSAKEKMIASKEQIEIANEGYRLAYKALQQSTQRQNLGTVRPFEILQAQEVYIKMKLDYLKSVSDYNKAKYDLYVALGNNM